MLGVASLDIPCQSMSTWFACTVLFRETLCLPLARIFVDFAQARNEAQQAHTVLRPSRSGKSKDDGKKQTFDSQSTRFLRPAPKGESSRLAEWFFHRSDVDNCWQAASVSRVSIFTTFQ